MKQVDTMVTDNRKPAVTPAGRKQKGFVLVLALVMLTVLTLIGVSSMNSATVEMRAAANSYQHQEAFVAVQSLIEYTIADHGSSPVVDFQLPDPNTIQTVTTVMPQAKNLKAEVSYTGCGRGAAGNSLEAGKGFSYNFYRIFGTGDNAKGTASSAQEQGVRFTAASC